MSKKAKKLAKEKNLMLKRRKKASQRALYDSYRDSGNNSKTLRARKANSKNKKANMFSHPEGQCGNIGCGKCFPEYVRVRVPGFGYMKPGLAIALRKELAKTAA